MSDLFHESIPAAFIESVFRVMNQASQHTFQVLTKRPARVLQLDHGLIWTPNIWMGTSIESKEWLDRLAKLKEIQRPHEIPVSRTVTGAIARPGLGRNRLGDRRRRIRTRCPAHEGGLGAGNTRQLPTKRVPFFFKQWGGVFKKQTGRVLDNTTWDQMPDFKTI